MPRTLEFHITGASSPEKNRYRLKAIRRGESAPLLETEWESPILDLTFGHDLSRFEPDTRNRVGRLERITAFGRGLFENVFSSELKKIWEEEKKDAKFLTLLLRFPSECGELAMIPWKFLHDGREFLAAGVNTTLTRFPLGLSTENGRKPVQAPLRLFALFPVPWI